MQSGKQTRGFIVGASLLPSEDWMPPGSFCYSDCTVGCIYSYFHRQELGSQAFKYAIQGPDLQTILPFDR